MFVCQKRTEGLGSCWRCPTTFSNTPHAFTVLQTSRSACPRQRDRKPHPPRACCIPRRCLVSRCTSPPRLADLSFHRSTGPCALAAALLCVCLFSEPFWQNFYLVKADSLNVTMKAGAWGVCNRLRVSGISLSSVQARKADPKAVFASFLLRVSLAAEQHQRRWT